jgi:ppGpp synthetase/RelA/SpoT-type nucleotidyltranferase
MLGLSDTSMRFLDRYRAEIPSADIAANLVRKSVEHIARETGAVVHVVAARAKSLESLRGKLRRKQYSRPSSQLTDLIGVRVITYYRDAVDLIVRRLQQVFEINEKESTDKRLTLGLRNFGYRSVHLIARLKPAQVLTPAHQLLRSRWFEIQVRSILEHAWAEIEHEIVYKSGVQQPDEILRRFAALAGSLELLDNEFLALRERRNDLVAHYAENYRLGKDQRTAFDVARLLGFLEFARPDGLSWRQATSMGSPFAVGLDVSAVAALKAVGMTTPKSLTRTLRSSRFRYAVRSFSAAHGIAPTEVSHLATVVLAVVVKNARVVQLHFPEMIYDSTITRIVQRRAGLFA